jgi:hypothetical protein
MLFGVRDERGLWRGAFGCLRGRKEEVVIGGCGG